MRAFLAIELPAEIRASLAQLSTALRAQLRASASWVREDNVHITLRFLGEVSEDVLSAFADDVQRAAGATTPCALQLEGVGVFPSPQRARVLWCGVAGETERLIALQRQCEDAAGRLGLTEEHKHWSPHVTLARFRQKPSEKALQKVLETFADHRAGEFRVNSVTLFSSALAPGGAVHTPLRKFPFSCPSTSSNAPSTTS